MTSEHAPEVKCLHCKHFDLFSEKDTKLMWGGSLRRGDPPKLLGWCNVACFNPMMLGSNTACASFVAKG